MKDAKYQHCYYIWNSDLNYCEFPWEERSESDLGTAEKVTWGEYLYDYVHFNRAVRFLIRLTREFKGDAVTATLLVLIIDWCTRVEPASKEWINPPDRFYLPDCYSAADVDGGFDTSLAYIARSIGVPELQVDRSMTKLAKMGFITQTKLDQTIRIRLIREKVLQVYYVDFDLSSLISPEHQDEPDDHHEYDPIYKAQ